jgi:hypothetical protein
MSFMNPRFGGGFFYLPGHRMIVQGDIMVKKQYVKVNVDFSLEGVKTPRIIRWPDGREFVIDRIIGQPSRVASIAGGGPGLRYVCEINGKEKYLWFEDPAWFVEAKE